MSPETKPRIDIEVSDEPRAANLLPGLNLTDIATFENSYSRRHPLGIYNLSTGQIGSRLTSAAEALVSLMQSHSTPKAFADDARSAQLCEKLLLVIYAAAEHVDDLEGALLCLFPNNAAFAKSKSVRKFKRDLSNLRRRVSGFANAVKHMQARIRLTILGFSHESVRMCLVGFFIEGVTDGAVGPSPIFHGEEKVISLPSFLWEVALFVYRAAACLDEAVADITQTARRDAADVWPDLPAQAILALTRIPNYSFDGAHPFESVTLGIHPDEKFANSADPNPIYGSLWNGWSKVESHAFHGFVSTFQGDGVTKSFQLAKPVVVRLQHWE